MVADAKLEAKAQVKKFEEELRLEQDMLVAALVAGSCFGSFRAGRQGGRVE